MRPCTRARSALVALATVVGVTSLATLGCQNEEIARTEPGGGNGKNLKDNDDDGNDDAWNDDSGNAVNGGVGTNTFVQNTLPTGTVMGTGTGTGTGLAVAGGEEGPQEYPLLSFNGVGYTTYKMDDHLAMTQTVTTRLDDNALTLDTTAAHVECGDLNGCDQGDVDEKVQANNIGAHVYDRVAKVDLDAAKATGFRYVPFAMFAKGVRAKNGIIFTFASYLPFYPWPGPASRYTDLDAGAITWTARVTASQAISLDPNLVDAVKRNPQTWLGNGKAVQEFTANVTVTKGPVDATSVTLIYELSIPEDKERMIYKYFPISKRAEYKIDTTAKNIMQIVSTGWSNGDKSKEPEESQNTFKLCSKTTASAGTQNFPCQ